MNGWRDLVTVPKFISKLAGLKLLTIFLALVMTTVTVVGGTLFFTASPFDVTYGLNLKEDIRFWKFDITLDMAVEIGTRRGFPQLTPRFSEPIAYFKFDSYPYFALFGPTIGRLPVNTFQNPIEKVWTVTWLNAGYVGNYLTYADGNIWVLGNWQRVNVGARIFGVELFAERDRNELIFGLGNVVHAFFGSSQGVILTISAADTFALHTVFRYSETTGPALSLGFRAKTKSLEIHFWTDESGEHVGDIAWKVGDAYVAGRLKGKTVLLVLQLPVW